MIKITFDNGEVYTEEQYKKDYIRMMDSLRTMDYCLGKKNCCSVNCNKCPLLKNTCKCEDEGNSDYRCLDTVEIVHDWAKAHPVKTNRDKLKEVFNVNLDKDAELYLSYYAGQRIKFDLTVEDRWVNQPINKWLDAEYKEPKEESEE